MLELYFAKGTVALASLIALEEIGADYELRVIDFAKAEQTQPDYLSKNPKGRVPLLITKEGELTETPAILTYLAQSFPKKNLAPQMVFPFAKMQEYMSYFASTFHVNHAHKLRGARWADDEAAWASMRAKVPQTMAQSAQYVEEYCLKGPYLLGEYSVADMHLFAIVRWFEGDGVEIDDTPKLRDWYDRMNARDAVKRALQISQNL